MNKQPVRISDLLSKRVGKAQKRFTEVKAPQFDTQIPKVVAPKPSKAKRGKKVSKTTAPKTVGRRVDKLIMPESAKLLQKPQAYQEFIVWLATPEQSRNPATQKLFAQKWKVDENTLSVWKQRTGFYDEVRKHIRIWGRDRLSTAVSALFANVIRRGRGRDFLALARYIDEFNPKLRVEDETPPIGYLSDEEREALEVSMRRSGLASVLDANKKREQEFMLTDEPDEKVG